MVKPRTRAIRQICIISRSDTYVLSRRRPNLCGFELITFSYDVRPDEGKWIKKKTNDRAVAAACLLLRIIAVVVITCRMIDRPPPPPSARAVIVRSRSDARCIKAFRRRPDSRYEQYTIIQSAACIGVSTGLLCKSTFPRGLIARTSDPQKHLVGRLVVVITPIDFVRKSIRYHRDNDDHGCVACITFTLVFDYPSVFSAVVLPFR